MLLDIQQIKEILPHRYPFLLIDKILDLNIEKRTAVAQKNVTANENFFNGHFPGISIMPGVLIIEAMAQTIGVLAAKIISAENNELLNTKKLFVLAGIDNVRIKQPVIPGDILKLHAIINKIKHGICKSHSEVYVDKKLIASADFIAAYKEM